MNNKELPLISVVTVVYNGIKDIERTIQSVVNQKYPLIEYIIIDGGSNDGTVDVIKKYEKYIDYWVSEPDGGIYYAMNKGIDIAKGEWIHFRNCGDYFINDTILLDFFEKEIDEDIIIVHGNTRFIFHNMYEDKKPLILSKSIDAGMPIYHPSSFIRTEYHKKNLYNTKYRSSSDYEFMYKTIKKGLKTEYRPITVATYNAMEGFSLTNWKIERKEIWDWRYPNKIYKPLLVSLDILQLSIRKWIYNIRLKIGIR